MAKRTYREFKQNFFTPKNKEKCLNKDKPFFRSGLESQLMVILDTNPNILKWGSENVVVAYKKPTDNQYHRYFIDFYVEILVKNEIKKILIEVKPHKETMPIVESKKMKPSTILYAKTTFAINQAKWQAAKKYADSHGMIFLIITDKNIKELNW